MAGDAGAPVVGFVRSGGARLQEGHAGLAGYGRIFRASVELSRKVPQISVFSGVSAGGGAYSPALTDFVFMTEDARMFLTGPKVVLEAMGEEISMEALGGPKVHGRNGVAHLVTADADGAIAATRHLLGLLPQSLSRPPQLVAPVEPDGERPRRHRPGRAAQGLRRPRRRRRDPRPGQLPRALAALGDRTSSPGSPASRAARSG